MIFGWIGTGDEIMGLSADLRYIIGDLFNNMTVPPSPHSTTQAANRPY